MEGGEEKEKSENEGETPVEEEPQPEEPEPEEPQPEEPPPEEQPPEEQPPEEPPPTEEESPPPSPPPEEPPPSEEPTPLLEEAPPPEEPESPPAPPSEPSIVSAKEASLAPVTEELPEESSEVTQSSPPSVKSSAVSKQKTLSSSAKSFSKSVTDSEQGARKYVSRMASQACAEGGINIPGLGNFNCRAFLHKRSPFTRDPPELEERRDRITNPQTPREYIINLREDLADFQESHGLPRTRDYSFLSLGLALAYETARALCSLFLMFAELFPIVAIVSLLMRFALEKLIEILETSEPVPKVKKSIIFALQMLVIIIPLWIFIGTIIIPLLALVLSIFKRMIRFKGRGKKCGAKSKTSKAFDYFRFF